MIVLEMAVKLVLNLPCGTSSVIPMISRLPGPDCSRISRVAARIVASSARWTEEWKLIQRALSGHCCNASARLRWQ